MGKVHCGSKYIKWTLERSIYNRKYILQNTQPSQYRYTKFPYRFAVIFEAPSILSGVYPKIVYRCIPKPQYKSVEIISAFCSCAISLQTVLVVGYPRGGYLKGLLMEMFVVPSVRWLFKLFFEDLKEKRCKSVQLPTPSWKLLPY